MKQLSSFMVLNINGGDRISYTYDQSTGNLVSTNNKESFFVVDETLRTHVEAIRSHIRENRLAE